MTTETNEIDLIRKHYGDFNGLYDPAQAIAHVKILLAELDRWREKVDATAAALEQLQRDHERMRLFESALAYGGAVELVRLIPERTEGDRA